MQRDCPATTTIIIFWAHAQGFCKRGFPGGQRKLEKFRATFWDSKNSQNLWFSLEIAKLLSVTLIKVSKLVLSKHLQLSLNYSKNLSGPISRDTLRYYRRDTPYRAILFKRWKQAHKMARYPPLVLSLHRHMPPAVESSIAVEDAVENRDPLSRFCFALVFKGF